MNFEVHRACDTTGAIATTVAPRRPWELHEIRLHFSGSLASVAFTATLDAGVGDEPGVSSKHDTVLYTKSMASISADLVKTWNPPLRFLHWNDQVDFAYGNSSNATYGLEVIYRIME